MLLAVASGAVGMMVLAQVATALTLAPVGFPEPWELGGPPAAVAPAGPAVPAVVLDPVAAATGLPTPVAAPPPSPAPAVPRAGAATPERPSAVRAPASRAASSGSGTVGSS